MTRKIEITVYNHTEHIMYVKKKGLTYGQWLVEPFSIGSGDSRQFSAEKEIGDRQGTEGFVLYECEKRSFAIMFEKPYGKGDSFIKVTDIEGLLIEVNEIIKYTEVTSGSVELVEVLQEQEA
ncbi:hypothetical protein FNW52_10910 [Flavobacterium sp. ZT3R18]|uniref:hypothetical protein n=1 Tax=Flavobacterium sp. ZT3R18 TaxID=2594429 RepID=UPI00117A0B5E|nr:hypothetical protein [Flavobacterium sp. ZT3R18]TRX35541.1 hypothetical protein FNW52_10910 [Flavobacterium sp. ZT3R18]